MKKAMDTDNFFYKKYNIPLLLISESIIVTTFDAHLKDHLRHGFVFPKNKL